MRLAIESDQLFRMYRTATKRSSAEKTNPDALGAARKDSHFIEALIDLISAKSRFHPLMTSSNGRNASHERFLAGPFSNLKKYPSHCILPAETLQLCF